MMQNPISYCYLTRAKNYDIISNMKQKRLTQQQRNFLADWGHLVQTYNVPKMAEIFGVSRQAVQQQIDKTKGQHENV